MKKATYKIRTHKSTRNRLFIAVVFQKYVIVPIISEIQFYGKFNIWEIIDEILITI